MAKKIGGLGKGLSAIFSENETEDKNRIVSLKISQIEPNRKQPRRHFDEEELAELSESISRHGVLQPILVRPLIYGGYQIVAGERRYRACRMAGLTEIPAIVRELSDGEAMQLALIENLQRSDLSPLEEAKGYRALIDDFDFSQEDVARTVGKSRSAVANMLRLLSLPDEVMTMLESDQISAGHARALLAVEDKQKAINIADKIAEENLSVRETEALVKKAAAKKKPTVKKENKQPQIYREVELTLEQELGTKVTIVPFKGKPGGTLCLEFYDPEELFKMTAKLADMWNRNDNN